MKTKFLIIFGIIIVSLGSVFTFMIIDMSQLQLKGYDRIDELTYISSNEQLQRVLDHCEGQRKLSTGEIPERNADGSWNVSDAIGLYYTNDTHSIDNTTCKWEIYERGYINMPRYEENRNELQQVLDYCNDTSGVKNAILYNYSNETHSINNNTCEWKEHENFPNTDNLCIPYGDQWVTGEEIRNQTHIFDKDSCTWKIDQDYDAVNDKGCPQFCPKETSFKKHPSYTKEEIEIMKSNGWKVYPGGIGWTKPNTPMITSIYVKNPNNPDELVLDIDAMLQLKEVLDHCQAQKDGLGTDAIFFSYSNETHYIDNDICEWSKIK